VDTVTPEEHVKRMREAGKRMEQATSEATAAVAEQNAQRIAVLAQRTQSTSVRVMKLGEKATLQVQTSSRALAREVRRWSREQQRAVELAERIRDVSA
jgi:hypothetical protein